MLPIFSKKFPLDLMPDFIELETSTFCNRSCTWCPNSVYTNRSKIQRLILPDLFIEIIKDLKNVAYSGEIALHNFNEPLLDPKLFKNIETIRKLLPRSKIIIFTNGDFLDKIYCEKLSEEGVSLIKVTLQDAIDSKNYKDILNGCVKKLGIDEENMKNISDRLGEKFEVTFNNMKIIYYIPHRNMLTSRGGTVPIMKKIINNSSLCFLPFSSSAISYEGNIKICCEIYSEHKKHKQKGIVGNLHNKSFIEMWFSDYYNDFRKSLLFGKSNDFCLYCPKNGRDIDNDKLAK